MRLADHLRLDGQTAVVTGCRRGIGRASAIALAESGADVIGVSAQLSDEDEVALNVRAAGRDFLAIKADLSDRGETYEALEQIEKSGRVVDMLVNNAGAIRRAPVVDHGDEDWDYVLSLNLSAPFILTRAIGAGMLKRQSGKVVFIASLLAFQGGLNVSSYAASKGAIGQLTKALANEWAPQGINVNAIAPGYIATDVNQAIRDDASRYQAVTSRIPAGYWGTPEDIAPTVVFLCSSASRYIHGTVVTVDGGWMGR